LLNFRYFLQYKILIDHNNIGDNGAKEISEKLLNSNAIQEIYCKKCGLNAVGCFHLLQCVEKNNSIKILDISILIWN